MVDGGKVGAVIRACDIKGGGKLLHFLVTDDAQRERVVDNLSVRSAGVSAIHVVLDALTRCFLINQLVGNLRPGLSNGVAISITEHVGTWVVLELECRAAVAAGIGSAIDATL